MPYKISEQAQDELKDILREGISRFGPRQAEKYRDSFERLFTLLGDMPGLGRFSERHNSNEHRFPHGPHVIYYRVEPNFIVIENVVHGATIIDAWGDG